MDEILNQLVDKAWNKFLETPPDMRFCKCRYASHSHNTANSLH